MKLVASIAVLIAGFTAVHAADPYDILVLAENWIPGFCTRRDNSNNYAICNNKFNYKAPIIHGVWPNNNTKQLDCGCTSDCYSSHGMDLKTAWTPSMGGFGKPRIVKEYNKHGKCFGFTFEQYRDLGNTLVATPNKKLNEFENRLNDRKSYTVNDLQEWYGTDKKMTFSIAHGFLSEIISCFDKSSHKQIDCPSHLMRSVQYFKL